MLRTGQRRDIYDFRVIRRTQDERVAPDHGAQPFLHPAYEATLFIPLSYLSYRAAYVVWVAVNFLVLLLIYLLLRPFLRDLSTIGPKWIGPALMLGFMPIASTILEGQDSLFLLLILVLVHRRIPQNEVQAGLLLSLGMFRFQVLLPIMGLFLVWRMLKFVAGWIAGSAVLLGISAAITGLGGQIQYLRLLRAMATTSFWLMVQRMPNLRALLAACGFGTVPVALASLFVFSFAAGIGFQQDARRKLSLAISVSSLVTYYLFIHDVSVLALPVLLAINREVARREWLRVALASIVLSGFAIFWFVRGRLYLGVLFSILFFATESAGLWRQRKQKPAPQESNALSM